MKATRVLLEVGFIVFVFCACNKNDTLTVASQKKVVVFSSSIGGESYTRASNAQWDVNDQIGVFMKTAGNELNAGAIVSNADNVCYVTNDQATFEAFDANNPVYYPENGTMVDFIAYYPYQSGISAFIYKVDVSSQTSQEAIDLLYSDNAKNQTHASHFSNLMFSHQLTKLKIVVKAGEDIPTLDGLQVSISGVNATADFNLANGNLTATGSSDKTIAFNITGATTTEKTAEAILVPDNGDTERVITFTLSSGKVFTYKIAIGTRLEKNTRYTFTAGLGGGGAVIEPQTGYVETPLMANLPATQTYVVHMLPDREGRNYTMLYDTEYRLAYWVAYPLKPSYHIGSSGRTNKWAYDPQIDTFFQPNLSSSFPGTDDRGHQIPSADRTCSEPVNWTTFYYSNMTAQRDSLNQKLWSTLEGKVRTWASACDTMYVVTGAMIQTATDQTIDYVLDNSNRNVARPKYYFKALAQRTGNSYTTVAFKIKNEIPASGSTYNTYRLSVKALEAETGFTFFPSLSDAIKGAIESNKWN